MYACWCAALCVCIWVQPQCEAVVCVCVQKLEPPTLTFCKTKTKNFNQREGVGPLHVSKTTQKLNEKKGPSTVALSRFPPKPPKSPNSKTLKTTSVREMRCENTKSNIGSKSSVSNKYKLGKSEKKPTRKWGTLRKHLGIFVEKKTPPPLHIKTQWRRATQRERTTTTPTSTLNNQPTRPPPPRNEIAVLKGTGCQFSWPSGGGPSFILSPNSGLR